MVPHDTAIMNHLWSISVEEQFYLFFPSCGIRPLAASVDLAGGPHCRGRCRGVFCTCGTLRIPQTSGGSRDVFLENLLWLLPCGSWMLSAHRGRAKPSCTCSLCLLRQGFVRPVRLSRTGSVAHPSPRTCFAWWHRSEPGGYVLRCSAFLSLLRDAVLKTEAQV